MNNPTGDLHPIAVAMGWVSRVMSVLVVMVLPGLAGIWLDQKWGTSFLAMVGFAIGMVIGMTWLLVMAVVETKKNSGRGESSDRSHDEES